MQSLERQAQAAIRLYRMLQPGDRVVVAVSGGADSVALIHLLHSISERRQLSLHAAHLDHGLRPESGEDARFVAGLADTLGIPAALEAAPVERIARERGWSIEQAGREARYRFFERLADRLGADRIATAHTADDQAETVLLNLMRGAGPEGLAGIPPVRGKIVRPLILATRRQVLLYCRRRDIGWREDATNLQLDYRRNWVRLRLLPLIGKQQPGIVRSLCRLAEVARQENELVGELARQAFSRVGRLEPGRASLGVAGMGKLPPALRRRVLRIALRELEQEPALVHVEQALDLLEGGAGREVHLPEGWLVRREAEELVVEKAAPAGERVIARPLAVPGATPLPEVGLEVLAREAAPPPLPLRSGPEQAWLDRDQAGPELQVRAWQPGDRFRPLGGPGEIKLQDFFVNRKVPRAARPRVPLVVAGGQVIWVAGHRIDERFRVTERTRRALSLTLRPIER